MGDRTGIEWAANADGSPGATWNPIVGCAVHTMSEAARIERMAAGAGRVSAYAGLTTATKAGPVWTGEQRLVEASIDAPLRWRRPRTIFAGSMSDWFADGVPDETLDRLWAVMALATQHTFIVLTKRPKRMREYLRAYPGVRWLTAMKRQRPHPSGSMLLSTTNGALPNVWLGVSAEDQTRADERIPLLLDTPAAVRLVSCEPLLGAVRLNKIEVPIGGRLNALTGNWASYPLGSVGGRDVIFREPTPALDWVIAGGESGRGARPMHPDWARALRDQCASTGVPFFFKQWGEWAPAAANNGPGDGLLAKVGKRAAGRTLDGRTHDARPPLPGASA